MYSPNETKNKILKAALTMINQAGFGSLSISELARQAKVSKQNLYYHYPVMEDVLIELAMQWSKTGQGCAIEALASSNESGARRILAIADGMFEWMKKYQELSKVGLVLFQSGPNIKPLNKFMQSARVVARERIDQLLVSDDGFKKLTPNVRNDVITAVHSLMYGFFLYVVAMDDFQNLKLHQKNCSDSLIRLLQSY